MQHLSAPPPPLRQLLLAIGFVCILGRVPDATAQQQACASGTTGVSTYVHMPDGVALAVTVFKAPMHGGDERSPVIAEFTRYGRLTAESVETREAWCRAGFNFVVVDTRGSGASFGSRKAELAPAERDDIGNTIDWMSRQPWSNGRILVTGLSYNADAAEMATGTQRPALEGALIRHSEFDVYRQIVFPGGVLATVGIDLWGQFTYGLDTSEECLLDRRKCDANPALAPVDGDKDLGELRRAVAEHQLNARADRDFGSITFSDDYFPSGVEANAIGAAAVKSSIAAAAVPVQEWASWMDAGTAASALERFNWFPKSAMEVFIAAWTHGGRIQRIHFLMVADPS